MRIERRGRRRWWWRSRKRQINPKESGQAQAIEGNGLIEENNSMGDG